MVRPYGSRSAVASCRCSSRGQRRVESPESFVYFRFGDDERRQKPYDFFRSPVDDNALSEPGLDHRSGVARQLDAPHEPYSAHLSDQRVFCGDVAQALLETPANARDVRHDAAVDQLVEERERGAT